MHSGDNSTAFISGYFVLIRSHSLNELHQILPDFFVGILCTQSVMDAIEGVFHKFSTLSFFFKNRTDLQQYFQRLDYFLLHSHSIFPGPKFQSGQKHPQKPVVLKDQQFF